MKGRRQRNNKAVNREERRSSEREKETETQGRYEDLVRGRRAEVLGEKE